MFYYEFDKLVQREDENLFFLVLKFGQILIGQQWVRLVVLFVVFLRVKIIIFNVCVGECFFLLVVIVLDEGQQVIVRDVVFFWNIGLIFDKEYKLLIGIFIENGDIEFLVFWLCVLYDECEIKQFFIVNFDLRSLWKVVELLVDVFYFKFYLDVVGLVRGDICIVVVSCWG